MATQVVNLYHLPKDWQNDPKYVYVGRPGKGLTSIFYNPHPVDRYCASCKTKHARGEAVEVFRREFERRIVEDSKYRKAVLGLRNMVLVCFCRPKATGFQGKLRCHAQVLAGYCDGIKPEEVE